MKKSIRKCIPKKNGRITLIPHSTRMLNKIKWC